MIEDRSRGRTSGSLTVDEAQKRVLAAVSPLPAINVPLDESLGLTLAQDVAATCDLPPFNNSAMDGYAVYAEDTAGASNDAPVTLDVLGEIPAGHTPTGRVDRGCAVRIMTGAPVPDGADAVERIENIERLNPDGNLERIVLRAPMTSGTNIRPAGEDARDGEVVLTAGTRLRPGAIALLAATGYAQVEVHRRPRVGILVTGDEVVPSGEPLAPGQIWNSNGPMIASQVRQCGGEPVLLGVASDLAESVRERVAEGRELDLLITTGGVSVGDFDVVKDVLRADGDVDLWKLRIRPGKPLAFGRLGETVVLGLPGNPVAAAIGFWQFGRAAILRMLGQADVHMPEVEAKVCDRIVNRGGRRQYVRVELTREADGLAARLAGGQGSAMLTSLARADGLLVIPEDCEVAEPGMIMRVQMPDMPW